VGGRGARGFIEPSETAGCQGKLQMNKKMLERLVGKQIRIRPMPLLVEYKSTPARLQGRGGIAPPTPFDHRRMVEAVDEETIRIKNTRSDLVLDLGLDHVREFMTDPENPTGGFLLLKSQVLKSPSRLWAEPIPNRW